MLRDIQGHLARRRQRPVRRSLLPRLATRLYQPPTRPPSVFVISPCPFLLLPAWDSGVLLYFPACRLRLPAGSRSSYRAAGCQRRPNRGTALIVDPHASRALHDSRSRRASPLSTCLSSLNASHRVSIPADVALWTRCRRRHALIVGRPNHPGETTSRRHSANLTAQQHLGQPRTHSTSTSPCCATWFLHPQATAVAPTPCRKQCTRKLWTHMPP